MIKLLIQCNRKEHTNMLCVYTQGKFGSGDSALVKPCRETKIINE